MAERKRRHRFYPRRGLDGALIAGESKCRCGLLRKPSIFKDWYYQRSDGSTFTTYNGQSLGLCPGPRPSQKEKNQ